uniref:Reticuline oxidase-like protein n=1 Tax=Cajanus cajan TaxID=3821 RepID=A0A151S8Z3_CAJCA|nr:Reticuline oxidase-like protein [Cajanus cajan]
MTPFRFFLSTLTFLLSLFVASSDLSPLQNFLYCLSNHPSPANISNVIYTPNHPSFLSILHMHTHNHRFSASTTPKPLAIVTAMHESHVQGSVTCAKSNGLQIRIRSGGHDSEGLSYVSDVPFVILDMFHFGSVDMDIAKGVAWVQAGATLGQVYYHIAEKSRVHGFPAGVCPTVGAGGHFSGGGYGNMMRKYGLSVDNIIDATLVDVNGNIHDRNYKTMSDYVKRPISKTALESMWELMMKSVNVKMEWNPYGGKMQEISPSETPFPHRAGNLFLIEYLTSWRQDGVEAASYYLNVSRSFYEFMTPYVSHSPREAFLNYRNLDLGANHPSNATNIYIARSYGNKYFRGNFERLVRVKSRVDPDNFFRFEQSIPPLSR